MTAMTSAQRVKATYEFKPVDHLFRREFYIWSEAIERWHTEGMPKDADLAKLFGYDDGCVVSPNRLGWCDPAFVPGFEEKVLESTDEYEIVRDTAGRTTKLFKGRRHGFMPTYLKHAVSCDKDWEEEVAPLLDAKTPQRYDANFWKDVADIKAAQQAGQRVCQTSVGGYMYMRALVGPEEICYMFVDNPGLIHKMMKAWLELADVLTAKVQAEGIEYDELFYGEDICYNHGLLISPNMVREFIFPYYQQLLANMRSRQKRRIYFQVDTDGNCDEAIDLYMEVGMDVMSPFEVAAGNDVVAIAKKYPNLIMTGGIDKRVMALGKKEIDEHLTRIIPFMVKRGGYIPTCDHGVPDNVSYENYMYYRKRMMELDH
jgi:hypothetical protein